ncbi:hypothetical protein FOZ62_028257 [Perkinsus olseni]|uniref:Uncharacterized protein n=1 Tax=Perkinsus olseni TaxID=32597 RepID=A0A7J6RH41_PEROL|nr:hypothetical protein FOZ62_028257 [Perkinsus olseni]
MPDSNTRQSNSRKDGINSHNFDILVSLAAASPFTSLLPLEICSELWSFLAPSPTLLKTNQPEAYFRSGDSVSVSFEYHNLIISRSPYVVGLRQLGQFPEFAWATNCEVLSACGVQDGLVVSSSDSRLLLLKYKMPQPMDLRAHLFSDDSLGKCIPKVASEKGKILYLSDRNNKRIIRVDLDDGKTFRSPPMRGLPLVSYEFAVLDGLVFIVNMLDSSILCWDSYAGLSTEWVLITRTVPRPRGLSLGLQGRCLYVSSALDEYLYRVILYEGFKVEKLCYVGQAQQLSYSPRRGLVALVNTYFNRVETWQETCWVTSTRQSA